MHLPRIGLIFCCLLLCCCSVQARGYKTLLTKDWKFTLGNAPGAEKTAFDDQNWRTLSLPHDWSIELPFDSTSPTGIGGGALRGGTGWYRKHFPIPNLSAGQRVFIDFDGVYQNSEVWLNGHYLGRRPNGYISFLYELTPYLLASNVLTVKVNNADQPNSRWYSGSGIYRNVYLVVTDAVHLAQWGTYITTPVVNKGKAEIVISSTIKNEDAGNRKIVVKTILLNAANKLVTEGSGFPLSIAGNDQRTTSLRLSIPAPELWSPARPYLYKAVTQIWAGNRLTSEDTTLFGVRYCSFSAEKGFSINGRHMKIRGVCNHHDLGCLGTAVNKRALERQLEILKSMGCNAIRTSHNPPAPELLDLADKMGFLVMDEAFDMWKKEKNTYDYHLYWDEWHKKDLTDQLLRDRNHPSVIIWSLGNEIPEQWSGKEKDTTGRAIVRELVQTARATDTTRPFVTANNEPGKGNNLLLPGVLDMVGYNYHHQQWSKDSIRNNWDRKPFIVTEATSALATRGSYDMPSDSVRRWPVRWDLELKEGNKDLSCSAYDNCSAPWGSTHEESLKVMETQPHNAGMFVWTGFDYIGEPTPYVWPARSSYFGIIDLAGFPKDVYYLYQSAWTDSTVLHLLPHWNWKKGDSIDVWAYYNHADAVELYLNGKPLGAKKKRNGAMHVQWRVKYAPGTLEARSVKNGKTVKRTTIHTAGKPAGIVLTADRTNIKDDGKDLSFITVKITDKNGNPVPWADNLVRFAVNGNGTIAGVDNGSPTSMESFKTPERKAFHGQCLAVLQSTGAAGHITLTATAEGLPPANITITAR